MTLCLDTTCLAFVVIYHENDSDEELYVVEKVQPHDGDHGDVVILFADVQLGLHAMPEGHHGQLDHARQDVPVLRGHTI